MLRRVSCSDVFWFVDALFAYALVLDALATVCIGMFIGVLVERVFWE